MDQSTPAPLSASHHASQYSARRRTLALAVVALAFIMDLLDTTIVNVAIPSIQANLGASYTTIQWLIAGYLLSFATLLITGGRMGDVYGYKKLFMIGVAGFTLASLFSGLAWNPGVLIAARLVQGAMAALMVPQVMSLMQVMYEPHERGGVMGLFGGLAGIAATLGPIVGGLLIEANIAGLDWRPIFLINVPVGIFALVAAYYVLPPGKSAHPLKLDWTGTVTIITALLLLVFPLVQGRELGWPVWTYVMMAASLPALALFAWYETRRMKHDGSALVVPSLFKKRSFSAGLLVNIIFQMAMTGYFLLSTLVLQAGLGYSAIKTAVTGIAIAIGISVTIAVLGQKLIPRFGRYVISFGTVIMAAGLAGIALVVQHFGLDTQPWHLALPMLITGMGMGFIMSPIFAVVLTEVDVKHAGSASGVLNAVQQVGGAVGIAAVGVVFFGLLSSQAKVNAEAVAPQIRQELSTVGLPVAAQNQVVDGFVTCFVDRSNETDSSKVPASCKVAENGAANAQIPPAVTKKIGTTLAEAGKLANEKNFSDAFSKTIFYEVALLALTFALSFLLPRKVKPEAMEMAA